MRDLNHLEKGILQQIIAINQDGLIPTFAAIIDPELINKEIRLNYLDNSVEIRAKVDYSNFDNLPKIVRDLTLTIVTTGNLLRDLERNGYLAFFQEHPPQERASYGQLVQSDAYVSAQLSDPHLTSLLLDYSFKSILIGQSLRNYISNKFRTDDKVASDTASSQNRRNIIIALIALGASVILGFIDIYIGKEQLKNELQQFENEQSVRLNIDQQNSIERKIDEYNKTLFETQKALDSLLRQGAESKIPPVQAAKNK